MKLPFLFLVALAAGGIASGSRHVMPAKKVSFARQQTYGTITAATTTTITGNPPTSLVANSFVSFTNLGPGPGTLQFWLEGVINSGSFGVYVLSPKGNLYPIPPSAIVGGSTGTSGVPSSVGGYSCPSLGGQIYIVATALGANSSVSVSLANGAPGGTVLPPSSGGGSPSNPSYTFSQPYSASLANYEFAGQSAAVTFNVEFLNSSFIKVGTLLNYSVPVANAGTQAGITFAAMAGGSLPTGAVYALVRSSANSYFDSGAVSAASDFTNHTTYAPILYATPDYQLYGNGQ